MFVDAWIVSVLLYAIIGLCIVHFVRKPSEYICEGKVSVYLKRALVLLFWPAYLAYKAFFGGWL